MGSKTTTQVEKADPWAPTQLPLNHAIHTASNMYGGGDVRVDPYEGTRVAPMSDQTMRGLGALGNIGMVTGATDALQSNLDMDETYRDFDTIRGTVADNVKANLASTFAGGGINSGMAQDTYSGAMTEALADVEYDAYNAAKARQMQAVGMAPAYQAADIDAAKAALAGGGIMDAYNQRVIDSDMSRHYEGENADWDALTKYAGLLQGIGGQGGTGVASSSQPRNIPGAGLTGLGTYAALSAIPGIGPPLAIGAGALAGLGSLL